MASFSGIYIRATEQQIADLRASYPIASTEPGFEFYELGPYGMPPETELVALSAKFDSDVLWLSFQSSADIFEFSHWRSGQRNRELVYRGYVWERVAGVSELWERGVFFDPEQLEDRLLRADVAEATELNRMWRAAEIEPGKEVPFVDPREPARAIAAYYHLPGWSLGTKPARNE